MQNSSGQITTICQRNYCGSSVFISS